MGLAKGSRDKEELKGKPGAPRSPKPEVKTAGPGRREGEGHLRGRWRNAVRGSLLGGGARVRGAESLGARRASAGLSVRTKHQSLCAREEEEGAPDL